jgi:heme/copper-type cytochrome/quinol oxidase subunit 4
MTTTYPRDVEATTQADLLKTSATVVWFCLIVATLVSWTLGTHHGFIDSNKINSITILVIAFIKVRFIGMYFMELKNAPPRLRAILEAWCVVFCALTIGFYLAA